MHRRTFIASGAALALLPTTVLAAQGFTKFKPGLVKQALANGETVFLDYATDWCPTCKSQERTVAKLMKQNPAYAAAMTFIRVDWDVYSRHEVSTSRRIPRRSTLLVQRGDAELGRIVANTREKDIKALMDLGLAAA